MRITSQRRMLQSEARLVFRENKKCSLYVSVIVKRRIGRDMKVDLALIALGGRCPSFY